MYKKNKRAFSLGEILLVLMIVSIVLAASVPLITRKVVKTREEQGRVVPMIWDYTTNDAYVKLIKAPTSVLSADVSNNGAVAILDFTNHGIDDINEFRLPYKTIAFGGASYGGSGSNTVSMGWNITLSADNFIQFGNLGLNAANSDSVYLSNSLHRSIVHSDNSVIIGSGAWNNNAPSSVIIGGEKDFGTKGQRDSVVIGTDAMVGGSNGCVSIGTDAKTSGSNGVTIGHGAEVEDDSIAIGTDVDGDFDGVAIGYETASANHSVAIGYKAGDSLTGSSVIIGNNITNSGINSVVIGGEANIKGRSVILGYRATSGSSEVAIGNGASSVFHGVAIGNGASSKSCGVAIGNGVSSNSYCVAIGHGISANSNEMVLGNSNTTVKIAGTLDVEYLFKLFGSGVYPFVLNSYSVSVLTLSDKRLKNINQNFKGGLSQLKQLDIYNYTFKSDESKTPHVGVIAQDLEKVYPEAVVKGEDGYLRIRLEDIFYSVINAVKELDEKLTSIMNQIKEMKDKIVSIEPIIEKQQKIIEEQQAIIDDLEKRIKKLESKK